jgi:methylenetetrahydrofolate reductase (NADPH)
MKLSSILQTQKPTFSCEFFPPKTEADAEALFERARELAALEPSFVSVTYGAGGSTRDRTRTLVVRLKQELGLESVPHLTCVGSSRAELAEVVAEFHEQGIDNILALRGDPPKGQAAFTPHPDGLHYANELVELIAGTGHFDIGVAGYPEGHMETSSKLVDMDNLKRKVDAGASCVITQVFFDNRDFYDFVERCRLVGITVPIIAGIMPIVSGGGIRRMAGMCGARLPAPLLKQVFRAGNDDVAVAQIGLHWATEQCRDLLDHGVQGIHFYTLNKSLATLEIYHRLGAGNSADLRQLSGE